MTYKEQMNDHIGFVERELEYSRQLHEKCKLYLSKEWHEHKRTCIEYFSKLEKENAEQKAQIESLKGEVRTLISANQQLNSMIKVKDECSREYIEQIEKLKCCGNCKHLYKDCTKEKDCKQNKYKHWELAE